jgi:hypothetical protein
VLLESDGARVGNNSGDAPHVRDCIFLTSKFLLSSLSYCRYYHCAALQLTSRLFSISSGFFNAILNQTQTASYTLPNKHYKTSTTRRALQNKHYKTSTTKQALQNKHYKTSTTKRALQDKHYKT